MWKDIRITPEIPKNSLAHEELEFSLSRAIRNLGSTLLFFCLLLSACPLFFALCKFTFRYTWWNTVTHHWPLVNKSVTRLDRNPLQKFQEKKMWSSLSTLDLNSYWWEGSIRKYKFGCYGPTQTKDSLSILKT